MQPAIDAPSAAALDDVLALARVPWVRGHLLRDDAGAELGALCAPAALDAAWAARVHLAAATAASPRERVLTAMLVPAAAAGSVTAGAAVLHYENGHTAVGRFARDDSDGALVLLERRGAHVDVSALAHDGATRTRRARARFRTGSTFRAALFGDRSAASAALTRVDISVESRACPMCRRRAERPCACRLAFISPIHATDFTPFRANMHALVGAYAGRAVRLYPGAAPAADFETQTSVSPASEPALIARLAHLAVQSLLVTPTAPVAPVLSPDAYTASLPTQVDSVDCSPKQLTFAESVESIIQQTMHPNTAQHVPAPMPADPLAAFLTETQSLPAMLPPVHTSPVSELVDAAPKWNYNWQPHHLSANPENSACATTQSPTTSTVSTVSTPTSQPSTGRKPARRARRTTKKVLTEEMLREREARRQLRIFKNRQAAARSNLRRKLQNDRLKKALAEVRGRALQLRDRHMVLREENLRLKMALLM